MVHRVLANVVVVNCHVRQFKEGSAVRDCWVGFAIAAASVTGNQSGTWPNHDNPGRVRGRMPIVLPFSPIGRSHPGKPGSGYYPLFIRKRRFRRTAVSLKGCSKDCSGSQLLPAPPPHEAQPGEAYTE